jgi:hypothetical protein
VAQILGDRWSQKYLVRNIMQGDGGCMLTVNSVETWMIERLRASFHTKTKNVCSESTATTRYTLPGRNH